MKYFINFFKMSIPFYHIYVIYKLTIITYPLKLKMNTKTLFDDIDLKNFV